MKFLVCCTTRNKVLLSFLGFWFAFFCGVAPTGAQQEGVAAGSSAPQAPGVSSGTTAGPLPAAEVARRNDLRVEGRPPFHLKVSFQVYGLEEKPADQGTLEYYWAGAKGSYLEVTSPALGTLHTLGLGVARQELHGRELFLLADLLEDLVAPGRDLANPKIQYSMVPRETASVPLMCYQPIPPQGASPIQRALCTDPASGMIRLVHDTVSSTVRNRGGIFGPTRVALEASLYFLGKKAIVGQVDALKGFDPATTSVSLDVPKKAPSASGTPSQVLLSPGVIAGHKTGGDQPMYPLIAREARVQGSVILGGQISREGKVVDLFPVASANVNLTEAAIQAVRTWTYQPYLLNGEPVAVSTTITVNFNLR